MKKIFALLLAVLILIGCSPYHSTKVSIDLENDLSGELVVDGSIKKSNTEEPLDKVQTVITDVVGKIDKYEGTLTSSIQNDELVFVYTESFDDLEQLNGIIKRLFKEDVTIKESNEEEVLKTVRTIEGLDFSQTTFMDEIYETIEKEKLFGDDSAGIGTYQQKKGIKVLFDDNEYSAGSTIEVIEYKKILNDELVITLEKENKVSATHSLDFEERIDIDELSEYFETKFAQTGLEEGSILTEKDGDKLLVTLSDVPAVEYATVEEYVFGRGISFLMSPVIVEEKDTGVTDFMFHDYGIEYSMENNIMDYSTVLDLKNYKIKSVGGFEAIEDSGFELIDNKIEIEKGDGISMMLEVSNPFQIIFTILKFIGIALLIAGLAVAAFFGVKKAKESYANAEENPKEENDGNVSNTSSETKSETDSKKLITFNKNALGDLKALFMDKNSLIYAGILFGVYVLMTIIVQIYMSTKMNQGLSGMGDIPIDQIAQGGTFMMFRAIMKFIGSGALNIKAVMDFSFVGGEKSTETVTFAAYMILFMIIITFASYFISKKVLKEEKGTLKNALAGSLYFVGLLAILSIIPISLANEMGMKVSASGSFFRVLFYTLPLVVLLTYALFTFKDKFNSELLSISETIYDGLVRSMMVMGVSAVVVFIYTLAKQKEMLIIYSNLIEFATSVFSGISFAGQFGQFGNSEVLGIIHFDDFMPLLYVFYIIFIIGISFDLNTKFKKNPIKDELKYALVYTGAIYLPIIFFGAISAVSMAAQGQSAGFRIDFLTVLLAPLLTWGLMVARLKFLADFGFELNFKPKAKVKITEEPVEKEEKIDVKVETVTEDLNETEEKTVLESEETIEEVDEEDLDHESVQIKSSEDVESEEVNDEPEEESIEETEDTESSEL